MSSSKTLTNAELELTQRIQMHFPRESILKNVVQAWNHLPHHVLTKLLYDMFCDHPVLSTDGSDLITEARNVSVTYPGWVTEVVHSDIEREGPLKFTMKFVIKWSMLNVVGTQNTVIKKVYEILLNKDQLKNQLGYSDLLAIQEKGMEFYKFYLSHSRERYFYGWRSVVRNGAGDSFIPYLFAPQHADEVSLQWASINSCIATSDCFGLRFKDVE